MNYRIKEIYFTQQGEGKNTGKDFVFVRFSGCNLWSGKEKHRASAVCKFVILISTVPMVLMVGFMKRKIL